MTWYPDDPLFQADSPSTPPLALEDTRSVEQASLVPAPVLEQRAIETLRTVYDPEIPLNIYDLGLIYQLTTDASGGVSVSMTLTAPGCPVAGELVSEVHSKLLDLPGVSRVRTELVWDPPWTRSRLSEAALLELGLL